MRPCVIHLNGYTPRRDSVYLYTVNLPEEVSKDNLRVQTLVTKETDTVDLVYYTEPPHRRDFGP